MIRLIRENLTQFLVFIAVSVLATTLMGHYAYGLLVSPSQLAATSNPNEGYYWAVAQYQIQFERVDNQIVRFAAKLDHNVEALHIKQQVLQSKFHSLVSESAETAFLDGGAPQYRESMERLSSFMRDVDADIEALSSRPETVNKLIGRFEEMRETINALANSVRFAEMKYREATLSDFKEKRSQMFATVMALWGMFIVIIGLYLLNFFRAKHLSAQSALSQQAERRAEEALAAAVFTKNTILGTISHELKTPLQTIMSSIDLLVKRMTDARDIAVVDRLVAAAERLEAQMEDVTDYARLGAGKLELRRIEFDLGELLERVVDEFQEVAQGRDLELVIRPQTKTVIVASDARRIEQIATNLITNAIKYTPSGRIQVSMEILEDGENPQLQLTVEDTGPGIRKDKLETLYEPFTQLDQSTTRKYDGAGMGLAIVDRLVDLFGGNIEVDSELGLGTRFKITLPVEVLANETIAVEQPPAGQPNKRRVLLVDDNAEVRNSMRDILEEIGYVTEVADGGKVALQMLATLAYDVILLDISMPGMDGFEVAAAIRGTSGANRTIPIVAISAYTLDEGTPAQQAHFSGYISKPVRLDALHHIVDEILAGDAKNEPVNGG